VFLIEKFGNLGVSNRNFGKFCVSTNSLDFPIKSMENFGVSMENLGFPREYLWLPIEILGNFGFPIENLGKLRLPTKKLGKLVFPWKNRDF